MRKGYFLKKKISDTISSSLVLVAKSLARSCKFVLTKRTILFVTNEKIRSVTLGPIPQALLIVFIAWVGNLFMQSLRYDEVISAKSSEINKLQSVNSFFEKEFSDVNEKLEKINEYLSSATGGIHDVKASEEVKSERLKNLEEKDLSRKDKNTLNRVKDVDHQLSNIQSIARARIKKIESAIILTGLNPRKVPHKKASNNKGSEISLNGKAGITDRMGGPLLDKTSIEISSKTISAADSFEKIKFTNEIDYLIVLENLVNVLPFSKPMKNYYISSGFGSRRDPITKGVASHHGLDFVGVAKEKIISPSKGKVILAGRFSDYGNAIVIDHGFGITTRYGHLSEIKVKEGQFVKQGEVIALQGNSGRSTGPHLHYEVRYGSTPLNPKKFLEAGQALFNDKRLSKYVSS